MILYYYGRWIKKLNYCYIGSAKIAYKIFGTGENILVIDACLGSSLKCGFYIRSSIINVIH